MSGAQVSRHFPTVVLLGTLDTKGREYRYVRDRVLAAGCNVLLVDAGVMGGCEADVTADEVARAAGEDRARLAAGERGAAVAAMARGATQIVRRLHADGRLDAVLGLGGSGGTAIVSAAMQALPVGVPKLIVSTMASGDVSGYVGTSDVALMHSVVDIAGINGISERILTNAAAAVAGMARAAVAFTPARPVRPIVCATMYGTTTPCVDVARAVLEERGYEVIVFHANGTGGRIMESLIAAGHVAASLDVTTAELVDEVAGGILSAGPERLESAGRAGIPQVVSLGGLDQVCFGPPATVPERYRGRRLLAHNPSITLMRPSPAEAAEVGRLIAAKLNAARGPVTLFIPLGGVSSYDAPDGPFWDPAADAALFDALRAGLRPEVEVVELPANINDPGVARAMADRLDALYRDWGAAHAVPAALGA